MKKLFKGIKKLFQNKIFRAVLAIASAFIAGAYVFAQTLNGYLAAAAGGFVGGVVSTGTLEGGLWGAVTGLAFAGIGTITQGWDSGWALAGKGLAHGSTAGALNKAQGGEFQHGFASAFFTTVASPMINDIPSGTGRVVAAAVVGGTSTRFAGGKFANGAVTGAFVRLFNDSTHRSGARSAGEPRDEAEDGEYYSLTTQRELASRMVPIESVSVARASLPGKILGMLVDIASIRTGGLSAERGVTYYRKVDTVVDVRQWFDGSGAALDAEIGLPYEKWDMNGTKVEGYVYEGSGRYSRTGYWVVGP